MCSIEHKDIDLDKPGCDTERVIAALEYPGGPKAIVFDMSIGCRRMPLQIREKPKEGFQYKKCHSFYKDGPLCERFCLGVALEIMIGIKEFKLRIGGAFSFSKSWRQETGWEMLKAFVPELQTTPHLHETGHLGWFGKNGIGDEEKKELATRDFKELAENLSRSQVLRLPAGEIFANF